MKRLFGFGKNKKRKKGSSELSPPPVLLHASSPMYQYARNEFAQTVASGTSNDDGRGILYNAPGEFPSKPFARPAKESKQAITLPSNNSFNRPSWKRSATALLVGDHHTQGNSRHSLRQAQGSTIESDEQQAQQSPGAAAVAASKSIQVDRAEGSLHPPPVNPSIHLQEYDPREYLASQSPGYIPPRIISDKPCSPTSGSCSQTAIETPARVEIDPDYLAACSASNFGRQESLFSQASSQYRFSRAQNPKVAQSPKANSRNQYFEYPPTMAMPDAAYEEEYGDAYIGGPMRYIYPSGYQSMRPRSGPWKLSIVICVLFTWLSVFIVGHCSDRVDSDVSQYNQNEIDDDTLVIETRWCGSRLLYMMWVISMLVTGLAAAYCSIIGYIKVRDFAVANSRSQPPGMVGKTDFYALIDEAVPPPIHETPSQRSSAASHQRNHYHVPIYQADGNPQFWGEHIYRPTQAAVAITSR